MYIVVNVRVPRLPPVNAFTLCLWWYFAGASSLTFDTFASVFGSAFCKTGLYCPIGKTCLYSRRRGFVGVACAFGLSPSSGALLSRSACRVDLRWLVVTARTLASVRGSCVCAIAAALVAVCRGAVCRSCGIHLCRRCL